MYTRFESHRLERMVMRDIFGRLNVGESDWPDRLFRRLGAGVKTGGDVLHREDLLDQGSAPSRADTNAGRGRIFHDDARHNFFTFEVVKAHVAPTPKRPETLHCTGDGVFVVAGEIVDKRALFRPEMLRP